MKSSLYAVRTAFKTAITSLGYAVYDRQRKVKDYPHVIIGEQTEQQNGDQGEFGQIATINVELYNAWASDYGEWTTTDDMVNTILQTIVTKPHSLVIYGFDMPVLILDSTTTMTEQTQTQTIVTTVLRFRMQLFEQSGGNITVDPPVLLTAETNTSGDEIMLTFDRSMSDSDLTAALAYIQVSEIIGNHYTAAELFTLTKTSAFVLTIACDPAFSESNLGIFLSYAADASLIKSTAGGILQSITNFQVTNNIIY